MPDQSYNKPLPKIDALTAPFWEFARNEQLAVQSCNACGDLHFPPTPVCPACLSDEQAWQPVSGRGEVQCWAVFHRAYWPGFADAVPYLVCVVKLEEGPLLVSNMMDAGEGEVHVGSVVDVVFDRVTETITLPKFRMAQS